MQLGMSAPEQTALQDLLAETAGDIMVRIDPFGFIETASSNISQLGYDLSNLLVKPHLADLVESHQARELKDRIASVFADADDEEGAADWLEISIRYPAVEQEQATPEPRNIRYALSLRAIRAGQEPARGALGLLRSIERVRMLEGIVTRQAFCASLHQYLERGEGGAMALFEVDRMRAIFMQYGQGAADDIIGAFAEFLKTMMCDDYELAQFDAERFCVILPGLSQQDSRNWAIDVVKTFASLTLASSQRRLHLSASAGLVPIEGSVDQVLQKAERALVMARAQGGMRVSEGVSNIVPPLRVSL